MRPALLCDGGLIKLLTAYVLWTRFLHLLLSLTTSEALEHSSAAGLTSGRPITANGMTEPALA